MKLRAIFLALVGKSVCRLSLVLLNPLGHESWFSCCKDDFVRIYEVLKAKAATMREITRYFTQKTVHLAMRCFNYAWENMLESKQVQRPIIDRLAATFASGAFDEVNQVYQKIRAGFLQELLTHAHHCYVQSISDHQVRMLALGAFG